MPVHYEVRDHIAYIVIEGRREGNLFSPDSVYRPLTRVLDEYVNDSDARCAVVSAHPDKKAFSYGGDIDAIDAAATGDSEGGGGYPDRKKSPRYDSYRSPYGGVFTGPGMLDLPKPMVFAVNGLCLGAGTLVLMTLGDIIVASEDAEFGLTEVKLAGPMPGLGAGMMTRQLPWRIALELLMTGRRFNTDEALRWGFINHVVPKSEVLPRAIEIAEGICENPPLHIQAAKELAIAFREMPYAMGLFPSRIYSQLLGTVPDSDEGFRAFVEKREPHFTGEWS